MDGSNLVEAGVSANGLSMIHNKESLVTFKLNDQLYGLPIFKVRDIMVYKELCRVPLSPREVLGVINIRGKIVTVVDLRQKVNLAASENPAKGHCLIIEKGGSTYGLKVDGVGDILEVDSHTFERTPSQIQHLSQVVSGVYQLEDALLILLDLEGVIPDSFHEQMDFEDLGQ